MRLPPANTTRDRSSAALLQKRVARIALAALFAGATGVAFSPVFMRLSELGPTATAFWRPTLALPALWLWVLSDRSGLRRKPYNAAEYRALILAGVFFAGDLVFWHWSVRLTSVANATLLANFAPIFVVLGAWLLFRDRVGILFVAGLIVALAGTVLIVGSSFAFRVDHLSGDLLGLITAVFFAAYILAIKRLRANFSVATIMAWSASVTSLALLPIALASGESLQPSTLYGWLVLAGLGLVSHAGGQSLIAYALAHMPVQLSSLGLLLEPVMATLFAWLLLHEALGGLQALGGALVLGGIFIAQRQRPPASGSTSKQAVSTAS
jgi:drug/metabolite transporter (DMT)-like permease